MTNQVITVDRKKYATGLFWQPVAAGFVPRNYARSLARTVDKKLNLYTDYRAMVGLGARRAGHRRGMHSAAAEVMDALTEYSSFLAVFAVGARFFLVAVRNGIILEDRLLDSESAARKEYLRLAEIPDWGALFAPSAWSMPRAIDRSITDVISGTAPAVLRPISRFYAMAVSVILVLIFLMGLWYVFGGQQWMAPQPQIATIDPELAAEYKRQIEEKNKELDEAFEIEKPAPVEPLRLPYDYLPSPDARAALCYQAIGFLMQPVSGWTQVTAECGEEYASVRFKRGFGTLVEFYNTAADLMPGAFVQEENENSLYVKARLPELALGPSLDERDADTVVRDVTSLFQSISTDAEINVVVDTITNGVDVENVNVVEIAASSKLTPAAFMEIFSDFGGVYMTRCTWDASVRTWNYEVIIYAK